MEIQVQPAPSTPLNLQFGVLYAPRIPTPPFVAFDAVDLGVDGYAVRGYDATGAATYIHRDRNLPTVYQRFALHLRMDVDAN